MTVLNAIAEGSTVYLLLDDARILRKAYENDRCAEVAAEQYLRLQIPTWQLFQWFDWTVHEEAPG
jgi:hypothetical protein